MGDPYTLSKKGHNSSDYLILIKQLTEQALNVPYFTCLLVPGSHVLEFCKTQSDWTASCSIQSEHVLPYPVFQILWEKACNHVTGRDIVTEKSTVIFDRFR